MELVPVNFHPRVVQLSLCQQSSSPRPQLNKNTDNAISNVSFQTVKARPSAKKTHRSSRGFSKRETVTMKPVKKDVHQVLPAFLFLRKTSGL